MYTTQNKVDDMYLYGEVCKNCAEYIGEYLSEDAVPRYCSLKCKKEHGGHWKVEVPETEG